jgi:hypothetical protein
VLTGLTLAVFFYAGAMFLQGYIYTEPSQELYWQAPAAGGALMAFLTIWCLLIVNAEGANPRDIPYDTIFRFSPRVDLLAEPAQEIWGVKKDGEKKPYKRKREVTGRGQSGYRYFDVTSGRPWSNSGIVNVELVIAGENYIFKRVPGTDGSNAEFVSDNGWVMMDYGDGPTGIPGVFRWGRFLMNVIMNVGHFLAWWLCLWLLLRFQWSHALGLGFALWLVFTFSLLPMLLDYAAEVAESKAVASRQVGMNGEWRGIYSPAAPATHVLAKIFMISPSCTMYVFPSSRKTPWLLASFMEPRRLKSA